MTTARRPARHACGGTLIGGENSISTAGFHNVYVHGPGLVRTHGVAVLASRDARVDAIAASTNCVAGVFVNAASFGTLVEQHERKNRRVANPGAEAVSLARFALITGV